MSMTPIVVRSKGITETASKFCPGCTHSTLTKLIAQSLEELGLLGETIAVLPIGCASLNASYITTDYIMSAHGRAAAVATGIKRCSPDKIVYTYQGDGDLASIGIAETLYAANRGEHICTFFVNNGIYGMTGGQMSPPTTLVGQASTTGGKHRNPDENGYPINVCSVLNELTEPFFIGRYSLDSAPHILAAKAAIKKALQYQIEGRGYCFLEFLSTCPTNWKLSPTEATKRIREEVIPVYPLGVVRDRGSDE